MILLENKLHPFSIFIRREALSEAARDPGVCIEWGHRFSFLFVLFSFLFCSVFFFSSSSSSLKKGLFCCLLFGNKN